MTSAAPQEFLVQPVDASWLQCNIECQEACPVGTNCRGYLNLAAEGRFEEGYILSRDPNPVAAMCSYVCSAPCERACRRGDFDRPLAIRAMKRFLVEWHEASGIPDVIPQITPRAERVAVVGAGPSGLAVSRELAIKGYQVTVFDSLPYAGGFMLVGVPAFRLPRAAIEMDVRLVERLGVRFVYNTTIGADITFDELQRDYDAIALTAGAMNAIGLDVPGADLEGVQYGVDFGYSTTLLSLWVRERGLISLEQAIHKLTFQVASIYGLHDRGLLRPGYAADITIFDPSTVRACEPEWAQDYPAETRRLIQRSEGVHFTIVNGQVIYEDDHIVDVLPGQVLRGDAWSGRAAAREKVAAWV